MSAVFDVRDFRNYAGPCRALLPCVKARTPATVNVGLSTVDRPAPIRNVGGCQEETLYETYEITWLRDSGGRGLRRLTNVADIKRYIRITTM